MLQYVSGGRTCTKKKVKSFHDIKGMLTSSVWQALLGREQQVIEKKSMKKYSPPHPPEACPQCWAVGGSTTLQDWATGVPQELVNGTSRAEPHGLRKAHPDAMQVCVAQMK
mmetsp:Transcript_9232/g.14124  ORF Transcript_9232/g.14124 Transcript_9232/m.14124 type:complete len:111 (+) Transcript_9232:3117-3449(+)|eukprot:CAMPEP_0174380302 /NCGR_PEP_ID=MMETSP0811_2-20130205/123286_1 /TAXON_ID=73025 ORGANISM="Eutreptiella gymnastica-like, Strain CCMP1594" /NCGR_SAMPLE_ID=MMETSP0811_2 /ASSEMBLY_ACC=CAM_ASM_000667 /LENGTH=110 /DNA_ID=CAMNT_0015533131 /DNA_START=3126 /DNA_END=3458 /DNA_ORIENTATION=+